MSDTSKMTSHELAKWCVAEFDAIDPEVHAEYRVDVWIAVRLARAVLEMAAPVDIRITGVRACLRPPQAIKALQLEVDKLIEERDAARTEAERLRGAVEEAERIARRPCTCNVNLYPCGCRGDAIKRLRRAALGGKKNHVGETRDIYDKGA